MCIKAICTSTQTAKKSEKKICLLCGPGTLAPLFLASWPAACRWRDWGEVLSCCCLTWWKWEAWRRWDGLCAGITAGGDPLRAYVYEATVLKIPRRAWVAMIGAAATLVGGIVYVASQGFCTDMAADLAFLLLHPAVFACIFGAKKKAGRMKWSK